MVNGYGHVVKMKSYNRAHFGHPVKAQRSTEGDLPGSFGKMLNKALDEVNAKETKKDNLIIKAGVEPDSVDVGELMNSIAQAEMSLNMTKAVTDKVINGYKQLINMR